MLSSRGRIHLFAGLSVVASVASIVVPLLMPMADGPIASAANAILVFLALLVAALVLAAVAFVITVRAYRTLSPGTLLVGTLPALVLGIVLLSILGLLRF